jgi:hypothetical protein
MTGGKEERRKIVSICTIDRIPQGVKQVGAKFKPRKHLIKNARRMVDDNIHVQTENASRSVETVIVQDFA